MNENAILDRKAVYQEKFNARLGQWNAQVDRLKARAVEAKADARLQYLDMVESLGKKRDALREKFEELKESGEDAWESVKDRLESAGEELKNGVEEAIRALRR